MVYKKYNASEPLCKSGNVEDHNTLETRQPGTKSSINGLGQHILMKGLLVREYLASDANAIDCIHWPTRTRERTRGPGKEKQILPVDHPRLVSQHCLPKIFYVNKILVHQKQK